MTDETDQTVIKGRDLAVIWRTAAIVAVVATSIIGGIITAVAWAVRHDARLEAVEKWQASKDREAQRELWRRMQPPIHSPGVEK